MKPPWANAAVYSLFDEFLEKSIIGNDSFLTYESGVISKECIDACIERFVKQPDEGEGNFDGKARQQFEGADEKLRLFFAHCIWLWAYAASDMFHGKRSAVIRFLGDDYDEKIRSDVFVDGGIGSTGQYHKQNKPYEIAFLILLLRHAKEHLLKKKDLPALKQGIVDVLLSLYYGRTKDLPMDAQLLIDASQEKQLAMHHILLHLCDPDRFEPITSNSHKHSIVSSFYSVLDVDDPGELQDDLDGAIFRIRTELSNILGRPELTFYTKDVARIWEYDRIDSGVDSLQLLAFKKALILYGPPGTSKTFNARQLAEALVAKEYCRAKSRVREFFEDKDNILSKHIHFLQLHAGHSYEDFVAGIRLQQQETVVQPGWLLQLLKRIGDDPLPHVIILDEINRVDLSRLFGELFSVIEYRDTPVQIPVGGENLQISLPGNVYFIGTMNEIDFSLERIDFALRRRFYWEFKGYDPVVLKAILVSKNDMHDFSDQELIDFTDRCTALNDLITAEPALGRQYQIGHTFFGEILDIADLYIKMRGQKRIRNLKKPAEILWQTSIQPILEAYFGTVDQEAQADIIKRYRSAFLP